VAEIMDDAVGRGDLQVWFADTARQSLLDGTMIAGALPRIAGGDFLNVVEFNVSASKANAQLERTITYTVTKGGADGRLVADLSVRYRNEGAATAINPYYAANVRMYVPLGSRIVPDASSVPDPALGDGGNGGEDGAGGDAVPAPGATTAPATAAPPTGIADAVLRQVSAIPLAPAPDGPFDVFGAGVVVAPEGGEATIHVRYELPDTVTSGGTYALTWYRQAGTPADHLGGTVLGRSFTANPAQRYFTISRST
jgi:hypothetical protein